MNNSVTNINCILPPVQVVSKKVMFSVVFVCPQGSNVTTGDPLPTHMKTPCLNGTPKLFKLVHLGTPLGTIQICSLGEPPVGKRVVDVRLNGLLVYL